MINSIKDLREVNGHEVKEVEWNHPKDNHIEVNHKDDAITFKMMTKPVSEGGEGCQLTDLISVALHQLKYLNGKFPCRENAITITKLEEALMWQKARTVDRVNRGVEGVNLK